MSHASDDYSSLHAQNPTLPISMVSEWDKVFPQSDNVVQRKVSFKNRYGITLVADVYMPKHSQEKLPAIVTGGAFGAVKEQVSGFYAQTLAEYGFITLAFDPSYTGESGGEPRGVASPEIFTEDFSAAIDYLGTLPAVDRDKIGIMAICGLSGMGLTAAAGDSRVKAVATAAMYNMSDSMRLGYDNQYTIEQQQKLIDHLSQQRWHDVDNHQTAVGWHELMFDEHGNIMTNDRLLPEYLPDNAPAPDVLKRFYSYYRTSLGYHPRSINSNTAWTATTPIAFFNYQQMTNADLLRIPAMMITGEKAHSRYHSEVAFGKLVNSKNKTLLVIPNADHVDLYYNLDIIPFAKLAEFFKANLK